MTILLSLDLPLGDSIVVNNMIKCTSICYECASHRRVGDLPDWEDRASHGAPARSFNASTRVPLCGSSLTQTCRLTWTGLDALSKQLDTLRGLDLDEEEEANEGKNETLLKNTPVSSFVTLQKRTKLTWARL